MSKVVPNPIPAICEGRNLRVSRGLHTVCTTECGAAHIDGEASGTKVATPNCGAPGGCSSLSISSAARTPTRNLVNRRAGLANCAVTKTPVETGSPRARQATRRLHTATND
eukprot:472638-Pyramimonas_sp.AAC.1